MAGECAKGRIIGSASVAPLETATRVEYASKVAALCSAMERTSHALRGCVSAMKILTGLLGVGSGTRIVASAWPCGALPSSFASVNPVDTALPVAASVVEASAAGLAAPVVASAA